MENTDLIPEIQKVLPSRKRRRPALSCLACRRRKVKCDREEPCDQCKKTRNAICTYSLEGLSAIRNHVHHSPLAPLTTRNGFNDSERDISGSSKTSVTELELFSGASRDDIMNGTTQTFSNTHSIASGLHIDHNLAQRLGRIEKMLSSSKIEVHAVETAELRKYPPVGIKGNMMKNRYFGPSHWMSTVFEAQSFMCFDMNVNSDNQMTLVDKEWEPTMQSALHRCKVLARAIKAAQTPQWTINGVNLQSSLPLRGIADELVSHYLRTHESIHRIVHIPSFEKEYAQHWTNPQSASVVSLMKILLIMAIGTCFYSGSDLEVRRTQAVQWIYTAQSWLASPKEKNRLNTATLQVECLLLLARSIYNIGADVIWNHAGSVLRTAMSMGFHRDPTYFKRYSILHSEIRRRLWATIMEINLQASLSSGMSPGISVEDFDTEPPSNINDDEIDESMSTHPASHPAHIFTQSSLQVALFGSFPCRLEVVNLVNKHGVENSYKDIIRLDKELLRNLKDCHAFLARVAQDPSARFRPTVFSRKIIDLKVQQFLLVLHRPFAIKARDDLKFYYSHKVYLDTAIAVHSMPFSPILTPDSTDDIIEDDYIRFRLMTDGFLKEILIHSVIIIYQEMIVPLEEDLPGFFQDDRKSIREPYLRLLQDMAELAAQRLAVGETSAKSHLMYSMAFAHINALEHKASAEAAMIEAAITSLTQCQEILRTRISATTMVEEQCLDGMVEIPGAVDLAIEDWGMEFEPSDSWLFSGWQTANTKGPGFS